MLKVKKLASEQEVFFRAFLVFVDVKKAVRFILGFEKHSDFLLEIDKEAFKSCCGVWVQRQSLEFSLLKTCQIRELRSLLIHLGLE